MSTRLFAAPQLLTATPARFTDAAEADQIRLLGAVTTTATLTDASPGVEVTLAWQAQTSPHGSYNTFVHLLDAGGVIVAQSDSVPGPGYATNRWLAGEIVLDRHRLELPADLPPGAYTLVTGLYDPISAVRLSAEDEQGQPLPDDRAVVQQITLPD